MTVRNRNSLDLANAKKNGGEGYNMWGRLSSSLCNYPLPFSSIRQWIMMGLSQGTLSPLSQPPFLLEVAK